MRFCTIRDRSIAGGWRLVALASAFAVLSACAERAYLADDGWRADTAGLSGAMPQPASIEPADGTANHGAADGTLVAANSSSSCAVLRLSSGGDNQPTEAELRSAFACLHGMSAPAYAASGHVLVRQFAGWARVTSTPFFSDALGDRYGVVFANARALGGDSANGHFDRGFPVGATLAVSTFTVSEVGTVDAGPLVFVEKMEPGFSALQGNWRYTVVETDGRVAAVTRGFNEEGVSVCADCTHSQTDLLYAALLNDGIAPYSEGAGPAFPSVDTYGASGGLTAPRAEDETVSDVTIMPLEGVNSDDTVPVLLDPNAPAPSQ